MSDKILDGRNPFLLRLKFALGPSAVLGRSSTRAQQRLIVAKMYAWAVTKIAGHGWNSILAQPRFIASKAVPKYYLNYWAVFLARKKYSNCFKGSPSIPPIRIDTTKRILLLFISCYILKKKFSLGFPDLFKHLSTHGPTISIQHIG